MDEGLRGTGPVHLNEAKETRRVMVMAMELEMHPSEWGQEHLKILHQSRVNRLYHAPPHGTRDTTRNPCSCKVEKNILFLVPRVTSRPQGFLLITKFNLFSFLLVAKALHRWACIVSITARWCPEKLQIKYQSHTKVRQLDSINRQRDSASL